ncbi:MAG: ABC transporter permease [Deltaproteobacteria bacterium]|jgi:lipoprotein-releasing system permease protein|nr:ABC transporter permease [Deltaproteobacteria bacterium]
MSFESEIALRYLRAKRRNSLLSLISVLAVGGVGLGVAALIVVLAVLAGFESNLKNKLLGLTAHVTIYKGSGAITEWREALNKIKNVPGVVSAMAFVSGQVMISSPTASNGVAFMGLEPEAAVESGFFNSLNASPHAVQNLTQRPMVTPWPVPEDDFNSLTLEGEVNSSSDNTAGFSQPNGSSEFNGPDSQAGLPEVPDSQEGPVSNDSQELSLSEVEPAHNPAEPQRPLIIGRELALILGVETLSQVRVVSPFGRVTPLGNRAPLSRTFTVAGTFRVNYFDYDSKVVYTTIEEAQRLLGMNPDEVSLIEVNCQDIYKADEVKWEILTALGDNGYWARDWMQMNMSLFSALKLEQTAMFVILTLIILVAAFNIASTLIMMVTEKTRDIAILKAMGASGSLVRKIFTIQGLMVGAAGTLGGLAVGVTLCVLLKKYEFISLPPEIYLMNTLPVEMRFYQVAATAAVSMLISYLATLYPSAQAAKLDPVEALRYE